MPSPDAPTLVAFDLPCVGCGYNLRTLARAALCPECATPVEQSFRAHDLDAASPAWLRRVRRGYLLLFSAGAVTAFGPLVLAGVFAVFGWRTAPAFARTMAVLNALLVLILTLAGAFDATAPRPFIRPEPQRAWRRAARLGLAAGAAALLWLIAQAAWTGAAAQLGQRGGWSAALLRGESLALLMALQWLLIALAGYTRALFPPIADSETGALAVLSFYFLCGAAFAGFMAGLMPLVGMGLLAPLFAMIGVCVEVLGLIVLAAAFAAAAAELRAISAALERP